MEDLIFFDNGAPAGIVAPSTLHADYNGLKYINGPAGIYELSHGNELSLQHALRASGSLIPGSEPEIAKVREALENPETSRTTSYLLCNAQTCRDVIEDLNNLRNASVVIAGCGGIGSAVALLLAGSGVKKLTLIDPDVIEKSNLNRQLFWTLNDINKPKVTTLRKVITERFENIVIKTEQSNVTIEDLTRICSDGVHALAVTADSPGTLAYDSKNVCKSCNIPVVSGGYNHDSMMLFTFTPGNYLSSSSTHGLNWKKLPSAIMPSYGPMNLLLASEIANRIISTIAVRTFNSPFPSIKKWKIGESPAITKLA